MIYSFLAAYSPPPLSDQHFTEEVSRLRRYSVPGMTGEAVGTFQGVRQRLRIGTSQERGLTTEPGTEKV